MTDHLVRVINGKLSEANPVIGSVTEQKARIRASIQKAADESRTLLIHFHGGLVPERGGIDAADTLNMHYSATGAVTLFVIWPTDIVSVIRNNLHEIFSNRVAKIVLKKLLARAARRELGSLTEKSASGPSIDDEFLDHELEKRLPMESLLTAKATEPKPWSKDEEEALMRELAADEELTAILTETYSAARALAETARLDKGMGIKELSQKSATSSPAQEYASQIKPEILFGSPDSTTKKWGLPDFLSFKTNWILVAARVLKNVAVRKWKGTDHTFYATVVEEVIREFYGAWVAENIWKLMKKDAKDAFGPDDDCFGSFFLRELNGVKNRPRVFLSSHSAGAIFASHLIESDPSGDGYDVAWVAPAVSYDQFSGLLTDHGSKIRNFRMFAMQDPLERADTLIYNLKFLYPSSLLYFVSGVCEEDSGGNSVIDQSLLGMQRYCLPSYRIPADRRDVVEKVREFLNGSPKRVVWSISNGGDGLNSEAVDHGQFDTENETVKSICHLVSNGYS